MRLHFIALYSRCLVASDHFQTSVLNKENKEPCYTRKLKDPLTALIVEGFSPLLWVSRTEVYLAKNVSSTDQAAPRKRYWYFYKVSVSLLYECMKILTCNCLLNCLIANNIKKF